jgi:protein SCO1/2
MRRLICKISLLLGMTVLPLTVRADDAKPQIPEELQGIGITEKPGVVLPLRAVFTDEKGTQHQLGDYFKTGKPVILQIGYFGCPHLCDMISQGMIDTLKNVDLNIGSDYTILHVSFDPKETYIQGYDKKRNLVAQYNRPNAADGWHMLVGDPSSVGAITDSTGFGYKWVKSQGQFAHAAVLMVLTPDGKVARYLYPSEAGMRFNANTLKLSIVEASQGKVGSFGDQVLLMCLHYSEGQYSLAATRLMKVGGVVTIFALSGALLLMFKKDTRRTKLNETTV